MFCGDSQKEKLYVKQEVNLFNYPLLTVQATTWTTGMCI